MKKHLPIHPILLFAGVLLGGCSQLELSGSIPRAVNEVTPLEPPLEVAWTLDVGGACGPDALQVHDGALVVGTRNGNVSVIEIETGRLIARGDFGGAVEGAVGITDSGTLIIPVANEKVGVVAHDLRRGDRKWTLEAGPHPAGVLIIEDRVIAVGYDGTIRALSPETGEELWRSRPDTTAGFRVPPVLVDSEHFVIADDNGVVSLRDVASGTEIWDTTAGGPVSRSIMAAHGQVLLPTTRGVFTSIDARSHDLAFDVSLGATVRFASPLVDDQRVYVGTSEGVLFAFDLESEETIWSHEFDGVIDARPAVSGRYVFVPTLDRKLHALDASDGSHVWTTNLPGRVKTNLVNAGGFLLACREPHHVVAFRSHTEEVVE